MNRLYECFLFIYLFSTAYLSRARRTPSLSTRSGLSRRPAVSLSSTGNPPMSSAVSTTSLVVPAMGDTIAAGLWPGGNKGLQVININNNNKYYIYYLRDIYIYLTWANNIYFFPNFQINKLFTWTVTYMWHWQQIITGPVCVLGSKVKTNRSRKQ